MRKYDNKNKINIGIIIGISILTIVMFSLVISFFINSKKEIYEVNANTLVFDKDKTIIKVKDQGSIRIKWNNDYYLKYNKKNYDLGSAAISYNEENGEIHLYGKYYEIGSAEEINVTKGDTVIKSSALTKFYKLDDRKYLLIDKDIKSLDGLISTTDFLMVDLDKVGNGILVNNNVSLKTFSETTLVTSNYTFDIANEILTVGSDKIDLKKIIGSSNKYEKEDLIPEENDDKGNDGIVDIVPKPENNNKPSGNKTDGDSSDTNGSLGGGTIIEEIKKASKKTSIVSVNPMIDKIDIDYVVYDPYKEYNEVYMEIRKEGSNNIERIYLNTNDTNYRISKGITPNTKYNITFKCSYIDPETSEDKLETIDDITVTTKLPSIFIKVVNTSFGKIGYHITSNDSFNFTSGKLTVLVNDKKVYEEVININGNTLGNFTLETYEEGDIIELILDDIRIGNDLIKDLNANYLFKY